MLKNDKLHLKYMQHSYLDWFVYIYFECLLNCIGNVFIIVYVHAVLSLEVEYQQHYVAIHSIICFYFDITPIF